MRLARAFFDCHLSRLGRTIASVLLLVCLSVVSTEVPAADLSDKMLGKLEGFVDREGTLAFAALYWLPESQQGFIVAVGELTWWHIADVPEFEDMLSPHQKHAALKEVAGRLARLTADERDNYLRRLDRWLMTYRQLSLMSGFVSEDMLVEAMICLPATGPLYDSVLASRGVDRSQVTRNWIVETMASAERVETWHEAVTRLSALRDAELMLYFRDLYAKLEELSRPEAGNN
jgi:hypothetical protein